MIYDKIFDTIIVQNGEVFNGKIILTDENISVMSNEHTVSVLTESDLLKKIRANSIVVMNQTVYCGSPMGVYRYNLQNQLETWFPIDPEKYYQRVYS